MTAIKFSVLQHEDDTEAIEVVCPVDDQLAVNLQCYTEYGEPWRFLERIYNDFCNQVRSLVREHKGIELSRDWIFKDQPKFA